MPLKLRPNSYFSILTMCGNKSLGAKGRPKAIRSIPTSDLYCDLVSIGDPGFSNNKSMIPSGYISDFKRGIKSCNNPIYMPFSTEKYVQKYLDKLIKDKDSVRQKFVNIIKKYIAYKDVDKMDEMLDYFLSIIMDDDVDPLYSFDFGNVKKNKTEFDNLTNISVDIVSLLTSIWTYILQNNTDSSNNDASHDALESYTTKHYRICSMYLFPELNHTTTHKSEEQTEDTEECDLVAENDEYQQNKDDDQAADAGQVLLFNGCSIGNVIQSGATVTQNIKVVMDDDDEW